MALLNEIDAIEDRVEPERSFIRDLKVYELEETVVILYFLNFRNLKPFNAVM